MTNRLRKTLDWTAAVLLAHLAFYAFTGVSILWLGDVSQERGLAIGALHFIVFMGALVSALIRITLEPTK